MEETARTTIFVRVRVVVSVHRHRVVNGAARAARLLRCPVAPTTNDATFDGLVEIAVTVAIVVVLWIDLVLDLSRVDHVVVPLGVVDRRVHCHVTPSRVVVQRLVRGDAAALLDSRPSPHADESCAQRCDRSDKGRH
jgi:hypothetical protein